jgi:long-chain acyl-CoA synthetase
LVFAENADQLAKLTERRAELPDVDKVVVFEGTGDGDWVMTLDDLADLGVKYLSEHPQSVSDAVDGISSDRLATLIYTSGTTGRPKGVRLRHEAWVYAGVAVSELRILSDDDLQLLWLPLAHAFGKVLISAQIACGFASAVDGRVDKIVQNTAVINRRSWPLPHASSRKRTPVSSWTSRSGAAGRRSCFRGPSPLGKKSAAAGATTNRSRCR